MKIERKELNEISRGIDLYDAQKLQKFRLTFLLTKNKKLINDEMELFETAKNKMLPEKEIEQYNSERKELAKTFWKKDEKGEYVMDKKNGTPIHVLENENLLSAKLEALSEKNSKFIELYNEGIEKAEAILEEEIEIALQKITDIEWVKMLAPKTLAALAPIIECELSEELLEEKGDALNTLDIERILKYCKLK